MLSADEVRRLRARVQGLYGEAPPGRTVLDAVRLAGGLQAQDARACRLQVRARTAGLTARDVDAACAAKRPEVVRTWLMRGTLHAVPAADARWLTALLGPRVADSSRGRRQRLGLDDELCGRALPALERVLAGRSPLTRGEVVTALAGAGVAVDPQGQAPAHLMLYAAAKGVLCRGPETASDAATYVLREEWLDGVRGPDLAGDDALAELAVRHVTAYGPVSDADFARWSGLPLGQARRGLRAAGGRVAAVSTAVGPLWAPPVLDPLPDSPARVRLTGHFDPYLLGYHDRDLLLEPAVASHIATGGGFLMPCVLHDGKVVATWRHERAPGGSLTLRVAALTDPLPPDLTPAIAAEVADLARFLSTTATWRWAPLP